MGSLAPLHLPRCFRCLLEQPSELGCRQRPRFTAPGKQPTLFRREAGVIRGRPRLPPLPQQVEDLRRQHHVPVLEALPHAAMPVLSTGYRPLASCPAQRVGAQRLCALALGCAAGGAELLPLVGVKLRCPAAAESSAREPKGKSLWLLPLEHGSETGHVAVAERARQVTSDASRSMVLLGVLPGS